VRYGKLLSLMSALPPKSGHRLSLSSCQLCAMSRHSARRDLRYSITSLAVVSSDAGAVRPSALAALRFRTIFQHIDLHQSQVAKTGMSVLH
jgi:hypothetical protein